MVFVAGKLHQLTSPHEHGWGSEAGGELLSGGDGKRDQLLTCYTVFEVISNTYKDGNDINL